MTVEIELPVPGRILSPNGRPHHHAKARAVKSYRTNAKLVCMAKLSAAFKPKWKTATIRIVWFHKHTRFPDRDNALASLKSGFDGLTDYGLFDDDRGLTHKPIEFQKDAIRPRVVLYITSP